MLKKPLALTRLAANDPASSKRIWHTINGEGHIVGRLATQIATVLQGKHKPIFDKATDNGDYVVVTNTSKLQFARDIKWDRKVYRWHSGHPGGLKEVPAQRMFAKNPNEILRRAVYGMLPKNPTRRAFMERLKLYSGAEHPHQSQALKDENRLMALQSGVVVDEARPVMGEVIKEREVIEYDPSMSLRGSSFYLFIYLQRPICFDANFHQGHLFGSNIRMARGLRLLRITVKALALPRSVEVRSTGSERRLLNVSERQ